MNDLGAVPGINQLTRWVRLQRRAWQRGIDASKGFLKGVTSPHADLAAWTNGLGGLLQAWSDNWADLTQFCYATGHTSTPNGVPVVLFVIDQPAEAADAQSVAIPWNVDAGLIVSSGLSPLGGGAPVPGHIMVEVDEASSSLRVSLVDLLNVNLAPATGEWLAVVYEDKLPPPKTPLAIVLVKRV